MGAFSRIRYVIAANVNSLIEKAEDPEKLLRALIREMQDAGEDARLASADLLAEQQHLERLERQLSEESDQWQQRAENAVLQNRDDLARAALKARAEIEAQHQAVVQDQKLIAERIEQMDQDLMTLKSKLADAKLKLKGLVQGHTPTAAAEKHAARLSPGERKIRRAMGRFDRLQAQVENLEARVRSYEVGGTAPSVWGSAAAGPVDPLVEEELARLKARISGNEAAESEFKAEPQAREEA
jgi:phage shock protein A